MADEDDPNGDHAEADDDGYWERLRFAYHQVAMRCVDDQEFLHAMYYIGVIPGTVEFAEAKLAWRRFHRAKQGRH